MNDTPDWLDDVLRARAVDDDGFAGRVARVGIGQRRATTLQRLLVVVAVVIVAATIKTIGDDGAARVAEAAFLDTDAGLNASAWVTQHRAAYRAIWRELDRRPGLERRRGRDAADVLEHITFCTPHGACNTSALVGLAAYDEWTAPASPSAFVAFAQRHLRNALEQPVVVGQPAPFAAAARDVEALARLMLAGHSDGLIIFANLALAVDEARAHGLDGGYVPILTRQEAFYAYNMLAIDRPFLTAGSDDDVAFFAASRSVLACTPSMDAAALTAFAPWLGGDSFVRRMTPLIAVPGCAASTQLPLCDDGDPLICRAGVAVAALPPWRRSLGARFMTVRAYDDETFAMLRQERQ